MRVTAERLREVLHYDQDTGVFTWLKPPTSRRQLTGQAAGCWSGKYRVIGVDGTLYRAHRLAWLHVTGKWPAHGLDHRDGDGGNNKWSNLREASTSENNRNRRGHGVVSLKGVSRFVRGSRFRAHIRVNGKGYHLGSFGTAEEAHAAYCAAAARLHGEFARTE